MFKNPFFTAKILLFGEYGIIENAMGLSIPFEDFSGTLRFPESPTDESKDSNQHLQEFYEYLCRLQQQQELTFELDLPLFQKELTKGIYFDSSIPRGFGIGSSGALCASIYNRYAYHKMNPASVSSSEIAILKKGLGQMESFFHGKSSGLDPLICYLNLPVLVTSSEQINTVGLPEPTANGKGAIFLINSGKPGQTQSMVTLFLEKCKSDGFRNIVKTEFKKYNDKCIEAFLNKDVAPLFSSLKSLSVLMFEHFQPMIPDVFKQLWKQGIDTNAYYLKLCGSGGGGYILGFAPDFKQAEKYLKKFQPHIIYRF
jgi:mevalonate kinase